MANPGSIGSAMPASEDSFGRKVADIERDIRELGPSIARSFGPVIKKANDTLDTVTALSAHVDATLVNIDTTVQTSISTNSMTTAAIKSLVAAPPTVASTGAVSGTTGTFPTGVSSTGVYGKLLTYGGAYNAQYVHVDGTMGYVPSSRRYKRDIMPATLDPQLLNALQLVTFRYIAAVDNLGDDAVTELGLIAEDVDALGMSWLVDYDTDGKPNGVKYERLALLMIPWAQSIEARLKALEG